MKTCGQHGIANNSGVKWQFGVRCCAWAFVAVDSDEARKSATVAIPGTLEPMQEKKDTQTNFSDNDIFCRRTEVILNFKN